MNSRLISAAEAMQRSDAANATQKSRQLLQELERVHTVIREVSSYGQRATQIHNLQCLSEVTAELIMAGYKVEQISAGDDFFTVPPYLLVKW